MSPAPPINAKRITVMGLGRFGGGVGVTRWLAESGAPDAEILVTDLDPAEKLAGSLAQIDDLVRAGRVTLRLGGHNVSDFTTCDLVIANPAVPKPWENRFLRAAEAAGIPITTEIRLLVERLPNCDRTIGVTGTAGKSTTSAMIAHVLSNAERRLGGGRVFLGGNIGGSLLPQAAWMAREDWIVLELSSAQLHWLGAGIGYPVAAAWSPRVAVLTNIAPNHLDWHGSMEHYEASKRTIAGAHSSGRGLLILGAGVDERCEREWRTRGNRDVVRIDEPLSSGTLRIPGVHNRINAAVACAAAGAAINVSPAELGSALSDFPGLPHRLQLVGEFSRDGADGTIRVFNDSKCTTPEAAALAIGAFEEQGECGASRIHLIAGGYDKKVDLSPMIPAAARCRSVYTIGATGPSIAGAVRSAGGRVIPCGELAAAVRAACEAAESGDAILLSPGCASWDQFTNFEERGDSFISLIRKEFGA